MDDRSSDPSVDVAAPVNRALGGIIVRSAVLFLVAALAVVATTFHLHGTAHALGHLAFPLMLLGIGLARLTHIAFQRETVAGEGAWSRAREVAPGETELAAFLVVVVPVSWLFGLFAILVRHAPDFGPEVVVGGLAPILGAIWCGATVAWSGDCRERLARAHEESSRRLRRYWSSVGRSA